MNHNKSEINIANNHLHVAKDTLHHYFTLNARNISTINDVNIKPIKIEYTKHKWCSKIFSK